MNNSNCFKDLFEPIYDYRRIVLILFLIEKDSNLLQEIGFNQRDINRSNFQFKILLIEQHEEYWDHIKNEEESVIEKVLNN